jgi:hypothetical protein
MGGTIAPFASLSCSRSWLANNFLSQFIKNNDSKLSCAKQLLKCIFIILNLENDRSHVTCVRGIVKRQSLNNPL